MKRKCRLLLTALLLVATTAWGQEPDEAALDSLRQRDDFVTASLLVSTPGEKAYSAYGHCVVRMECPTFDLDYCFSFELYTDDTPGDYLRFFSGRTKAGFQAHKTSEYLQQCRHDGRGVTQWTLSLNPRQKQELWRGLDENIMEGMTQQFDYSYHNCTSMSFWAVGSQLQGERLVVKAWPEVMRQSVRDMYTDYSRTAQWMQLGLQTIMGTEMDDLKPMELYMVPEVVGDVLRQTVIVAADGTERPALLGEPVQLLPATYVAQAAMALADGGVPPGAARGARGHAGPVALRLAAHRPRVRRHAVRCPGPGRRRTALFRAGELHLRAPLELGAPPSQPAAPAAVALGPPLEVGTARVACLRRGAAALCRAAALRHRPAPAGPPAPGTGAMRQMRLAFKKTSLNKL